LLSCGHRLFEEKVNVLGDIELVIVVVLHAVLEEPVYQLADAGHWGLLGELCQLVGAL